MPIVIDRTHAVKHRKGVSMPLRYEVMIQYTDTDVEEGTGIIVAKFAHCGDAHNWARTLTDPSIKQVIVRN